MDKDRNGELSDVEFSTGLSQEEPLAVFAGKKLYRPLVEAVGRTSMKPPQFYRFFALAITKPAEFAWQKGERTATVLYEHSTQDAKAELIRQFIVIDTDSYGGISKNELVNGFNSSLLQAVRAAKIPVSNLLFYKREMNVAEADFDKYSHHGSDNFPNQLSFVEFVELSNEAHRKAFSGSMSHRPFGCITTLLLLYIGLMGN